jgi:hypothetical protein
MQKVIAEGEVNLREVIGITSGSTASRKKIT